MQISRSLINKWCHPTVNTKVNFPAATGQNGGRSENASGFVNLFFSALLP